MSEIETLEDIATKAVHHLRTETLVNKLKKPKKTINNDDSEKALMRNQLS